MPQIPILLQIAKLILYLSQGILLSKENRGRQDQEPSQTPGCARSRLGLTSALAFGERVQRGPRSRARASEAVRHPGNQPARPPLFSVSAHSVRVRTAPLRSARLRARESQRFGFRYHANILPEVSAGAAWGSGRHQPSLTLRGGGPG